MSETMETTEKKSKKSGYRKIMKNKEYMKSIFASFVNRFGDSIDSIAMTWLVYEISGSASLSSLVFAVNFLPTIFLQPLAGAFVEPKNKKRVMITTDLGRGLLVALLAYLAYTNQLLPIHIIILTIGFSSFEAFRLPAGQAIVPLLLESDDYEFGLSLNTSVARATELIGVAMAGIIIGAFGLPFAIFLDAVTFFASAFILMTMKVKEVKSSQTVEETANSSRKAFRQYLTTLREGFKMLTGNRAILTLCLLAMFLNGILVPFNALQSVLVHSLYGMGSEVLSLISTGITLGSLPGTFVYPYLQQRFTFKQIIMVAGLGCPLFYILLVMIVPLTGQVWLFCGVLFLISLGFGLTVGIISVGANVQMFKTVPSEYMARVGSLTGAMSVSAMPLISFILSIVMLKLDIVTVYIACGVAGLLGIAYFVFKGQFEQQESTQHG